MPKRGTRAAKSARSEARDIQMKILVTPAELAAFEAAAEKVGTKLSEWVRQMCRKAAGMPSFLDGAGERSDPPK